jgi:hypothetical protein
MNNHSPHTRQSGEIEYFQRIKSFLLATCSPFWRDIKVINLNFNFISPNTRQSGEIADFKLMLSIEGITEGVIEGITKE